MRRHLLILPLLLTGCEVGPTYQPPTITIQNDFPPQKRATTSPTLSNLNPIVEWWTTFNDPVLTSLIERAVNQNLDLKRAAERIREARYQRGILTGQYLPTVNADASYEHAHISKNGAASAFGSSNQSVSTGGGTGPQPGANGSPAIPGSAISNLNLYQVGFDANWEIDIFGGTRRSVESASAQIDAAIEDQHDVLLSLLAEVARNYIDLRSAQRRLTIANENLSAQRHTADLLQQQVRQGITNQFDLTRANALADTTASQIPTLQTNIAQSIHLLSTLLAFPPDSLSSELTQPGISPGLPPSVPIGLPSDLLRRRPDLRRAERLIAAATARVGAAKADLFPKFNLVGSLGLQSTEPGSLLDYSSRYYSLGPQISWPILDFGQIRNRVSVERSRTEQAVLSYRSSVLTAFREVEDSLVAYNQSQYRTASLRSAVANNEKSTRIAQDLFSQGLTDFLSVLDAERTLYTSQDALATAESQSATALVSLYKSLGGGWQLSSQNGND